MTANAQTTIGHNGQMYVNKAICESFAAINVQMFARVNKLQIRTQQPDLHT